MPYFNSGDGLMAPGAYLHAYQGGGTPIFWSIPDFTASDLGLYMNNVIDSVIVMPGFKLTVYADGNYEGTSEVVSDFSGNNPITKLLTNRNSMSSCRLHYYNSDPTKQKEIELTFNTTVYNMYGNLPYTFKGQLAFPGAYLINGTYGCTPIFYSIKNLGDTSVAYAGNTAERVYVMPGFALEVRDGTNYSSTYLMDRITNTFAHAKLTKISGDRASSCRLYFFGTEITHTDYS